MKGAFISTILIAIFALWFSGSAAQGSFTVNGYIKDDSTGEAIIGANIYIQELLTGTSTDVNGFYSLSVPKGEYTLVVKFIGYDDILKKITLNQNIQINLKPKIKPVTTGEVIITGEKIDKNVKDATMGTVELSTEEIRNTPALLGETDIIKTLQMLPGVQSTSDGNSGFYVRGGGPDQNLILLDEAPMYNASHLFGFFSIFNTDALENIKLIKGGMPANYGGRLSSVLDITTIDGDDTAFHSAGSVGLISSKIIVQGPIKKKKVSFFISARRTYVDLLAIPVLKAIEPDQSWGYFFYDINAKITYHLGAKDKLFLSGYIGRDVFKVKNNISGFELRTAWGNSAGTFGWRHIFNDKLMLKANLIFTGYSNAIDISQGDFLVRISSGIDDINFKLDFNYYPNESHQLQFGANFIFHTFTPTNVAVKTDELNFLDFKKKIRLYSYDGAAYILDNYNFSDKIGINIGLRYSFFQHIGSFNRFVKNETGLIIDTIKYKSGENVQLYQRLEPRVTFRYTLTSSSSIKAAFSQNYQYIHLVSYATVSLPSDVWVPSTEIVKPQLSTQYALGYFRNVWDNKYETSVESYYKAMKNLIEYRDGYAPEDDLLDNPDNNFVFGNGNAYGVELFVKKRTGKTTGWIGYTLSWTTRDFSDINFGKQFYAKYDRRHDISLLISHKLNKKWEFSSVFVFASGNTTTLPVARYTIEGKILNEYGLRNSYRMAPYHRLDLSATFTPVQKKKRRYESSWNFGVYNAYNRNNPYFIYFDETNFYKTGVFETKAKQVSLFPILPSISWSFKF